MLKAQKQTTQKAASAIPSFVCDERDASASEKAFGKNILTRKKRKSFLKIFVKNLGDPVIKILLFALFLNILFMLRGKDWHEGAGIAISVICATLISSISEYKRDFAYERLNVNTSVSCKVLRDGAYLNISANDLVVGDVIELSAGERIPADCIILEGTVKVDQAPLTGESEEIEKSADKKLSSSVIACLCRFFFSQNDDEGSRSKDELNDITKDITPSTPSSLLCGCHICFGRATALVFSVGDHTHLGRISDSLSNEDEASPLRERLDRLAKQISRIGYIASALIALAYLFNIFFIESSFLTPLILQKLSDARFVMTSLLGAFTVALTVIVMAVPEGLPMMIAVVLSRNAGKMARDNVLVRHAPGIEAAGCMNILFTDKTGTLTAGDPSICCIITPNGEYSSKKELRASEPHTYDLLALCSLFNTSSSLDKCGKAIGGNTAERVLLSFASSEIKRFSSVKRTDLSPFDSIKKRSSAKISTELDRIELHKGAPEVILREAELALDKNGKPIPIDKYSVTKVINAHASLGERLILCAASINDSPLCVVCAVAMKDPLRPEAIRAVSDLRLAGIHVVMITGDGRHTAERIASDCKILSAKAPLILSGEELSLMSDEEISNALDRLAVVYRALPEHKSRLVKIAKSKNLTCGMTGDGLNDAPALKFADCGFALGCGSDVAKDAADIIILDNNLSSVVNAVTHGRNIFCSIRKFITLQLIINFTAMAVSMAGPFIGIDDPITVVQMLWINIVMDTLGGLAFAGEYADKRLLREKPIKRDEPVLNKVTISKIARLSVFSFALCIFFLKSDLVTHLLSCNEGSTYHLTAFFAMFIFTSAVNCFNARSDRLAMLSGISRNPTFIAIIALVVSVQTVFIYFGSSIMRTVPLTLPHLLITILFALPTVPFELAVRAYKKMTPIH